MLRSLVGSEMCIRDRYQRRVRGPPPLLTWWAEGHGLVMEAQWVSLVGMVERPSSATCPGGMGLARELAVWKMGRDSAYGVAEGLMEVVSGLEDMLRMSDRASVDEAREMNGRIESMEELLEGSLRRLREVEREGAELRRRNEVLGQQNKLLQGMLEEAVEECQVGMGEVHRHPGGITLATHMSLVMQLLVTWGWNMERFRHKAARGGIALQARRRGMQVIRRCVSAISAPGVWRQFAAWHVNTKVHTQNQRWGLKERAGYHRGALQTIRYTMARWDAKGQLSAVLQWRASCLTGLQHDKLQASQDSAMKEFLNGTRRQGKDASVSKEASQKLDLHAVMLGCLHSPPVLAVTRSAATSPQHSPVARASSPSPSPLSLIHI
eukprot:TRINITY_DN44443_c0_g1_i1.p1 TRINITY_DN44443_c0_g1~~TRINITY_DN44443_c0_g1_i1.p1  ORF type:complete len:380 (-),score=80.67 TRINITY_DN44443_c0_g1_i1:127-1266(-)